MVVVAADGDCHRSRRTQPRRWRWSLALLVQVIGVALWLCMQITDASLISDVDHRRAHTPQRQGSRQSERTGDIVVVGGIDGRVYAMDAWTGKMMWMFDSGGPMVDSSNCENPQQYYSPPQPRQQHEPPRDAVPRPQSVAASRDRVPSREQRSAQATTTVTVAVDGGRDAMMPTKPSVLMSQIIPSYDGRLYRIAGASVHEFEMTMVDIVNANGPVRLMDHTENGDTTADSQADSEILLFGDKQTKVFSLDAARGIIQPYLSRRPVERHEDVVGANNEIIFGRAEFKTRAVHAKNSSHARCFTISEYFLHFATENSARCALDEQEKTGEYPPDILVLPSDPEATKHEDEESTVAAFDPWTNEQLWEVHIPQFDAIAVFGVSASHSHVFYQWRVDGPSSTAMHKHPQKDLVVANQASGGSSNVKLSESIGPVTQPSISASGEPDRNVAENNQLTSTVPRDWGTMESRFRMRRLGGNYFLESSAESGPRGDGGSQASKSSLPSSTSSAYYDIDDSDELRFKDRFLSSRRRRVFWESMENDDGKRGVFITYYHVGVLIMSVTVGMLLIARGFYARGLSSASLAQRAFKSMERNQLLASHMHQVIIERPGQEPITITSLISQSLMIDTIAAINAAHGGLTFLENGDRDFDSIPSDAGRATTNTSSVSLGLSAESESALMEKFSQMTALEIAALVADNSEQRYVQLEYDATSSSSSALATTKATPRLSRATSSRSSLISSGTESTSHLSSYVSTATLKPTRHLIPSSSSEYMQRYARIVAESVTGAHEDNDQRVSVVEELEDDSLSSGDGLEPVSSGNIDGSGSEISPNSDDSGSVPSIASDDKSSASSGSDLTFGSTGSKSRNSSRGSSQHSSGSNVSSTSSDNMILDKSTEGSPVSGTPTRSENRRKNSTSSSSSSSSAAPANDAEVLFPFVCQSRFANEFEEISALGKGGFGQVMLAENRLDGRKYAIKRVGLHLKNQTSKTLQKFLREVKILALLDHPSIVRYYQAWLEKVEEGESVNGFSSSDTNNDDRSAMSSSIAGAPVNAYSMSNLLAPISEMEFSDHRRSVRSYSGDSMEDDGGFEWERDSADDTTEMHAWGEEDVLKPIAPGRDRPNRPRRKPARTGVGSSTISPHGRLAGMEGGDEDGEDSSCYSIDRCDHWLYIQMQYCAGRNLGDYLATPKRSMELAKLLKIFSQIASAIAHVHSCGLIHRDLKPANIFVADTDGDSIKLGDFGLSRYAANVNLASSQTVEEHHATSSSVLVNGQLVSSSAQWSVSVSNMSESNDITGGVGTYLYASPEQVAGKKYNAKTDMYSLGMILFELCHERFGTTMERYMTLRDARDGKFPTDFPWRTKCPELMEMLERLLHHDPLLRPDSEEVMHWTKELLDNSLMQHASSGMSYKRSPVHQPRSFHGMIPVLDTDMATVASAASASVFALQVEARVNSSGDGNDVERNLPNHNLLKEVCDVIETFSQGRTEIKKCGLHLQDGGAQILDFVLDQHLPSPDKLTEQHQLGGFDSIDALARAIQALPGVQSVRLGT